MQISSITRRIYMMNNNIISSSSSSSSSSRSRPSLEGGDEEKPHILAVDDSHLDRLLVAHLLRKSNCSVTIVENGMKALEYLGLLGDECNQQTETYSTRSTKVDLVLSDYYMPGMTGYELLKKIKDSSHTKEVPVVIMSSESEPTIIKQCLEEGAEMFIKKPLKLSDVKKLRCKLM